MSNNKRCVISGIGLATSAGCDVKTFWNTLKKGKPLFRKKQLFGEDSPHYWVSDIDDQQLEHQLSKRQTKKLDRFTILSIATTRQALIDSNIEVNDKNRERIGIIVGNCTAGWTYVEPEMYKLYTNGMKDVGPYVATSWFPAAPQGEISILYGIEGYSKTVCADRISAGIAIEQALRVIQSGEVDTMLAGCSEAPLNSLVFNAYLQGGQISPTGNYQPFTPEADGNLLGEGAATLIIENAERAEARNAKIYCEILAIGKNSLLVEAMRSCLQAANVKGNEIDYVVLDATGEVKKDDEEYQAIKELLGENANLRISAPKSLYGNLVSASMAVNIAVGCLSLERQTVLPTAGEVEKIKPSSIGKHVVGIPENHPMKYVLVNERDEDGQSLVILLKKPEV